MTFSLLGSSTSLACTGDTPTQRALTGSTSVSGASGIRFRNLARMMMYGERRDHAYSIRRRIATSRWRIDWGCCISLLTYSNQRRRPDECAVSSDIRDAFACEQKQHSYYSDASAGLSHRLCFATQQHSSDCKLKSNLPSLRGIRMDASSWNSTSPLCRRVLKV